MRSRFSTPAVTPPFQLDDKPVREHAAPPCHRVPRPALPAMQKNLMLRPKTRGHGGAPFLDDHGFIDIETPMLWKSTPEGARDYLVPSRVHRWQFFAAAVAAAVQASC